jgi:methylated-DNA-protein-cysteine methyltransferase-like protein
LGTAFTGPRDHWSLFPGPWSLTYSRIYAVIRRIPRGRVATYGQVAKLAGIPEQARRVGYALSALPDNATVPWHRVINARGEISPRADPGLVERIQRALLEAEGVEFDEAGRVDLARYLWRPRQRRGTGKREGRRAG